MAGTPKRSIRGWAQLCPARTAIPSWSMIVPRSWGWMPSTTKETTPVFSAAVPMIVAGGSLGFRGPHGETSVPLAATDDVADYRVETVELPPGRYDVLRLEALPRRDGGRLDLRATRLYALPLAEASE